MSDVLYLDHAATAPVLRVARQAWLAGAAEWANPSSPHAPGRAQRAALEGARARVADAFAWTGEVLFTSGASEAIALAMTRTRTVRCCVTAVEHDAVLRLACDAERLPVAADGRVGPASTGLADTLVAVQAANSETGVLQPLAAIAREVDAAGGTLFVDAAQTGGKLALPGADMIAVSGHKFGAPPGIGALLIRDFALLEASGGQERGYRAGTENVPGALAMAAALEAGRDWIDQAAELRAWLDEAIEEAGGEVVARDTPRIPTVAAYRMPGTAAAAQLIRFDLAGIAVSAGSACASGSLKPSHVLAAIGLGDAAREVIRVSIGRETSKPQLERFVRNWREIAAARALAA